MDAQRAVEQHVAEMLGSINQEDQLFAGPQYDMLRVVARFPLDMNFNSSRKYVQSAICEDNHPLARLQSLVFTAGLGTSEGCESYVTQVRHSLEKHYESLE